MSKLYDGEDDGRYYASGHAVFRSPIKTERGFTMGFRVCDLADGVGEDGAQEIADALNSPLKAAMQWLLDDMNDAGETHDDKGKVFDSVEHAAAALVEAGGNLNWYSLDDAKAYRARDAQEA